MENDERIAALRTACAERISKLSDTQVLRLLAAYETSRKREKEQQSGSLP